MCAILANGGMACWENGEDVTALDGTFYSLAAEPTTPARMRTDGRV